MVPSGRKNNCVRARMLTITYGTRGPFVVRQGGSRCTKSGEHGTAQRSRLGHFTQVRAAAKRKTLLLLFGGLIGGTRRT